MALELLGRLRRGLARTVRTLGLGRLFRLGDLDDAALEEMEERLLQADLGPACVTEVIERLRQDSNSGALRQAGGLRPWMERELLALLKPAAQAKRPAAGGRKPAVWVFLGVNGVGKTTTAGKLAWRLRQGGFSVLLAAGDTFRAAAGEQLELWAGRAGCQIVRHKEGGDPSAVVFDAWDAAASRGVDFLLVDTAGRLHTKKNLMEECAKINRTLEKKAGGPPEEVFLVLDAGTGQNALQQARMFAGVAGVTGLVLTKLDGTAKGGIVFQLERETGLPVRYVGVGEGMEDLLDFDPAAFVRAILQDGEEAA